MKSFKRKMRLLGYIILIVLASVGIGIGGAVTVPPVLRTKDRDDTPIELLETKDDDESDIDDHLLQEQNG